MPAPRRLGGKGSGRKPYKAKASTASSSGVLVPAARNAATRDMYAPKRMNMRGPLYKLSYRSSRAGMNIAGKGVLALGQHFVKGIKDKAHALAYFDASSGANQNDPIALPSTLGLSITQNMATRNNINLAATAGVSQVYIIQFCDSQAFVFAYTQAATPAVAAATINPILFSELTATQPTNIRASRGTVGIINSTAVQSVSGTISVLQIVNNLEWEFDTTVALNVTSTFQNEITAMLTNNSKSKEYSASDFSSQKKFSLLPSSMAKLQEYRPFVDFTLLTNAQKAAHIIESAGNYSHGTLIIKFNSPSVANSYTLQYNGQLSCRHPANSLLGSLGKKTPNANENTINTVVENASSASAQGDHSTVTYGRMGSLPSSMG
jgi:hypothetical protein